MSDSGSDGYASADDEQEFYDDDAGGATGAAAGGGDEGDGFWEADGSGEEVVLQVPVGSCELTAEDAMAGLNLFLNNRFDESERFFMRGKDYFPIFSLAYGVVLAIKALLTFEGDDIKHALQQLQHAEKFASKSAGGDGMVKGVAKKMLFLGKKKLSSEEVGMRVIMAEARLAASMLQMLEESLSGFVKAGLGIRRAWKGFEECRKLSEGPKAVALSDSDKGGVEYGVGAFQLVIALLPPRVLRMVEMMGFSGDRDTGLAELEKCLAGRGLRWPVAAMLLLAYHAILPSFLSIPQQLEHHLAESDRILAICLQNYPDGCLFQFILGRKHRLRGDLQSSSAAFERSMSAQREWIQLQHICMYELAWNHMFSLRWSEARDLWLTLLRDSKWSKAFFAYMAGACLALEGNLEAARERFKEVAPHVKRKIGGKTVSAEQYVVRKVNDNAFDTIEGLQSAAARLMGIEAVFLWNGFSVLQRDTLTRVMATIDDARRAPSPSHMVDDTAAVCSLLTGTALKWLGDTATAETLLRQVADECDHLTHDVFVVPHAMYELGVMLLNEPTRTSEAKKYLKKAQKFSRDYNFEMRLRFRLHAASKLADLRLADDQDD